MDAKSPAIERLQRVCSELAELQVELVESDIEQTTLTAVRDSVYRMRMIALALQQGLERFRVSQNRQAFLVLLIDERMRHASQLNTEISKDLKEGRIRTDQAELAAYLLVLNQVMEQLDLTLGTRETERSMHDECQES